MTYRAKTQISNAGNASGIIADHAHIGHKPIPDILNTPFGSLKTDNTRYTVRPKSWAWNHRNERLLTGRAYDREGNVVHGGHVQRKSELVFCIERQRFVRKK